MRAQPRLALISLLSGLVFVAAVPSPGAAQVHGVPPSVTSFGFGGSISPTPGIPASVMSVGPFGWGGGDCCFGPFASPFVSPSHWPRFDGHRGHNHHQFPVGPLMPVYVPYAYPVPYGGEYGGEPFDGENADVDYTYSRGVPLVYDRGSWYRDAPASRPMPFEADSARREAAPPAAASEPARTVLAQPATVLVYRDGHRVEVQNYAIVGDTLFDFADNRSHKILLADLDLAATEKANEDRGVDFQVPAGKPRSK